jgi:hypothetical protein
MNMLKAHILILDKDRDRRGQIIEDWFGEQSDQVDKLFKSWGDLYLFAVTTEIGGNKMFSTVTGCHSILPLFAMVQQYVDTVTNLLGPEKLDSAELDFHSFFAPADTEFGAQFIKRIQDDSLLRLKAGGHA